MKNLLVTVVLAIQVLVGYAQFADSLENALKTAKGEQKVKNLNELFRAYINSDPVKAIGYTREALSLATEINDEKGMAASYNNLGVSYKNQGALDKGLEYYLISLRIYEKLNNREGIGTTKNNIGTIYSLKKDFGQAMKYFEESYKEFSQLNDKPRIIGSLNNLGNLHTDLHLYEQALKYYSQAWQMSEQAKKQFSDPLTNLGNLYFRQGNYQRSVDYYEKALTLAKRENNKTTILNITANLGEVFDQLGQSAKAQIYFDSALRLCKELQNFVYEPQILKNRASNYARQGKTKEAYEAMVAYDKAKEKVYGEESTRKIAQMEMALDLQEKEKQVEGLKQQSKIDAMELRNSRLVITIIVLSAIVALGLFNLFMTRRKRA
ncbi:MAG: tetratricopeptide repeat protein [Bacteroidetes bacterium]|nr:tetratricopeptide repeat protein [Bacteroidota bacterium]